MNGRPGDDPLLDILHYQRLTFSPEADSLIREIVALGGQREFERTFNLFRPPPLPEFVAALRRLRDALHEQAEERGWDVP